MEMAYICLYRSYLRTLEPFSDQEVGTLIRHMLRYLESGEPPVLSGNLRFIWATIQDQIDRDAASYDSKCRRNRENGMKGGRPKNQAVISKTDGFSENRTPPKEKKRENAKKKERENENACNAAKPPSRRKYGSYKNVLFTDSEYSKLQQEFPGDYADRIERLSEYIASTGKSYKCHLATIRSWARKDGAKAAVMPNYGGAENWSL